MSSRIRITCSNLDAGELEARSTGVALGKRDLPVVCLGDPGDNGESDTIPTVTRREPVLEDSITILLGDSRPGIFDVEPILAGADTNRYVCSTMTDSVPEQILFLSDIGHPTIKCAAIAPIDFTLYLSSIERSS